MAFWKKKKQNTERQKPEEQKTEVLQQDLSKKDENNGLIFTMALLFEDKVSIPDKEKLTEIFDRHMGGVECFSYDGEKTAGFILKSYTGEVKEGRLPVSLLTTGCIPVPEGHFDAFTRSQFWHCRNRDEILARCRYQLLATDFLAATLEYKDRAKLEMDYMYALLEAYPQCRAIYFTNSGTLFSREDILKYDGEESNKFLHFAVNIRFFRIQDTEDFIVDTTGMSALHLPDLQYHFHGMNPDWVINHAWNMLCYIFEKGDVIKGGDTVDGMSYGQMDIDVQWKCNYEEALIQPARHVLDINMGQYASGKRNN